MKIKLFTIIILLSISITFGQTTDGKPSGSGTSGDPYLIGTLENLSWVIQNNGSWSKYFEQTADIDASETATWDDSDDDLDGNFYNDPNDLTSAGNNEGWAGIGSTTQTFTGTYDGQGFTIDGVAINRPSATKIGFFGNAYGGTIKNLGVINININVDSFAGALVGYSKTSTFMVDNCYATGSLAVDNGYVVGGLVGYVGGSGDGGTIQNSYSEVNVTTNGIQYAGGLVGMIKGSSAVITKCYSTGNVTGTNSGSGSFVGEMQSNATVSECYCTGSLTASASGTNVGGFIGSLRSGSKISNCHSSGSVIDGHDPRGGFVGQNADGTIEYSYTTGSCPNAQKGFLGNVSGSVTHTSNYIDTEASGCNDNINNAAASKTTSEMKTQSTFSGWDFINTWEIVGGDGANYPRLQDNPDPALPVELTTFEAVAKNGSVLLTWETATEVNNYGFDVEASTSSATGFEKIGFVAGHGNSNSPNSYSFVASAALNYRLKQIDTDGGFEYSQVISVSGALPKTEMYQNHPNPFNPTTQISFTLAKANNVNISVFNVLGEKVADLINSKMVAGNHKVNFDASELTTGVYIYRIDTPNYTKSMKMLLLK